MTFGTHFNQPIDLTKHMTQLIVLEIDCNDSNIGDNISNGVKEIVIERYNKLQLNNVPNSVKNIAHRD